MHLARIALFCAFVLCVFAAPAAHAHAAFDLATAERSVSMVSSLVAMAAESSFAFENLKTGLAEAAGVVRSTLLRAQASAHVALSDARARLAAAVSNTSLFDTVASRVHLSVCKVLGTCEDQLPPVETAALAQESWDVLPSDLAFPRSPGGLSPSVSSPTDVSPSEPVVQQITHPVVERIVERVVSGVDDSMLASRLEALRAELLARISQVATPVVSAPSPSINLAAFAASQRIDKLDDVTITNATISSGSVAASTISGTLANAIGSAAATITDLIATTFTTTNASTTVASAYDGLFVGRTATTTIHGDGVASLLPYASSTALTVSGTGYFGTASTSNLTVSSMTAGSVLFALSNGVVSQDNGSLYWDNVDNRLGVGTTSPLAKLSVHATASETGTSLFAIASSTASATSTLFVVKNDGKVGIGTTSPGHALEVAGNINFTGKILEDGVETFATMIAPFAGSCPTGWTEYTAARGRAVVGTPSSGTNEGTVGSALSNLGTRTITDVPAHLHTVDPPNTTSTSNGSHNHSISLSRRTFNTNGSSDSTRVSTANDAGSTGTFSDNTGSDGAHTHTTNIAQFNSGSTGSASVDVTMPYIQLTYCQKSAGADLAEWIPASEDISAATIVSVDPENREKVIASRKAYDDAVVGIVATQPGWLIGQEAKGSVQMALAGRVPVRVTLKNGAIKPGDPITTSSIPGVGMKATKAGPIVGKAMEYVNETSSLTACTDPTTGREEQCGEALGFVNVSWYSPTGDTTEDSVIGATGSFYEPLSVGADFETGDITSLLYDYAPKQGNPTELEKVGFLLKATTDYAAGVVSKEIGGPGELLRRVRTNNTITEEIRLVTSGKAEVKVSTSSDAIMVGDAIAISHEDAGMAEKAEHAGFVIGRAMEAWTPESTRKTISVILNATWFEPEAPRFHCHQDYCHRTDDHEGHHHDHDLESAEQDGFFAELLAVIRTWLADGANGIARIVVDLVAAKRVETASLVAADEICLGSVCVTEAQFAAVFGPATIGNSSVTAPSPSTVDGSTMRPIMHINGANPAIIHAGDTYADLGAMIVGPDADKNLGIRTFINGKLVSEIEIETSAPATSTIDYVVTGHSGLTSTSTRTVVVRPAATNDNSPPPTATMTPPSAPDVPPESDESDQANQNASEADASTDPTDQEPDVEEEEQAALDEAA